VIDKFVEKLRSWNPVVFHNDDKVAFRAVPKTLWAPELPSTRERLASRQDTGGSRLTTGYCSWPYSLCLRQQDNLYQPTRVTDIIEHSSRIQPRQVAVETSKQPRNCHFSTK
jgi:hypothetical protein